MGSLHILRPRDRNIPYEYPKRFRKDRVRAPYGSLWISYGLGNIPWIMYEGTVRARADAIYWLGNIRMTSHDRPNEAR